MRLPHHGKHRKPKSGAQHRTQDYFFLLNSAMLYFPLAALFASGGLAYNTTNSTSGEYDYVIIGSGPGGGPLA